MSRAISFLISKSLCVLTGPVYSVLFGVLIRHVLGAACAAVRSAGRKREEEAAGKTWQFRQEDSLSCENVRLPNDAMLAFITGTF